jgi:hypothetical protein
MGLVTLPKFNFRKVKSDFKDGFKKLSSGGFKSIFNGIDQLGIKQGVDRLGIDKFITQCALLAAGSGAVSGLGGITTMLIGVPVDFVNLVTQQFRVTMAIAYHKTGHYTINFEDLFKMVASSLKVDTGMSISKNVMEQVAEKLLLSVGTKTAERLIPLVGAAIGGTVNYLFIKRVAASLLPPATDKKTIIVTQG